MRRLIEDAALCEAYGACARATVRVYETGVVLDKLEAFISRTEKPANSLREEKSREVHET
jgi:hypothetical protein